MENYRRWISYDWFKLAVALLLLIVFILLMLRTPQATTTASADLPDYPEADFNWSYDSTGRSLRNPQGIALFSLSADGSSWQPVVPPDLEAQLPSGFRLAQGAPGEWELLDSGGRRLYLWDSINFRWNPEGETLPAGEGVTPSPVLPAQAEATTPPTQAATATILTPSEAPTELPSPTALPPTAPPPTEIPQTEAQPTDASPAEGTPTAALPLETPTVEATTEATAEATAAITSPLATETPAAVTPTTEPTLEATPSATAAADCPAPSPSRLVIGGTARVLTNLNLRSAPEIANNIVKTHVTGTTLSVLQGPVCVPYQNSAYLWWEVEGPGGVTGWSAEAFLNGNGYFLEPVP